jgi:hypothetical protein
MARWTEPEAEEVTAWKEWVASRPAAVRKIAERLEPWTLYRLKDTGQRVTLYSISEDGTVTVDITGEYNAMLFDRQVFGINPNDLIPCDLPAKHEVTGTMMTPDEVDDNIDVLRATIRPDLFYLDEEGVARRKS